MHIAPGIVFSSSYSDFRFSVDKLSNANNSIGGVSFKRESISAWKFDTLFLYSAIFSAKGLLISMHPKLGDV